MSPPISLPYFDALLAHADGNPESDLTRVFATRHVHWGYYAHPETADASVTGLIAAADALSGRIAAAARIGNGMRALDVGCGFGGTIAHLNERYTGLCLTGLNIDHRQLRRAQTLVAAQNENHISFVAGDACALPLPKAHFDRILAVECIFHFGSRLRFFHEARRVIRSGGLLALSDFIPHVPSLPQLLPWLLKRERSITSFYGPLNWFSPSTWGGYQCLARLTGFRLVYAEDITRETLPTYPVLLRALREIRHETAITATEWVAEVSRKGWVRYGILGFLAV